MQREDTLYEVLEVSLHASTDVIEAAYRCLVQHYHPDKNQGTDTANDRLAQINLAYAILSDPAECLRYDRKMGLHCKANERRGMPLPVQASADVSGHSMPRPFGFRPL